MSVAYAYDGTLYLAVTRRCTLACTFCPKVHGRWTVAGNDMSRDREPTYEELWAAALQEGLEEYPEVAFVGLGEPTLRLDLVCRLGTSLRSKGHSVRLVTDGLASLRHGHDVAPQLAGAVNAIHVSLNAPDAETYARLCPNPFGHAAHAAACDFIRSVRPYVPEVRATFVAIPGLDLDACEQLASNLGVPSRIRPYFEPLSGQPHDTTLKHEEPSPPT